MAGLLLKIRLYSISSEEVAMSASRWFQQSEAGLATRPQRAGQASVWTAARAVTI
jgi:hypothetical protein